MLRLPRFSVAQPKTVAEAVRLLGEHGPRAALMAGGTDLLPALKHRLLAPEVVVSLASVRELGELRVEADGTLVLGAGTTLEALAVHPEVRARAPALAEAAGLVAGPQLRHAGTLGGNVMLDTRCRYYNQTEFWRSALGYCIKKDGDLCHVVPGGRKCVAAVSSDTPPVLMTLSARLVFEGMAGRRECAAEELFHSDGAVNKRVAPDEILVAVRVPPTAPGHRGAYGKLRDRGSIDFPELGVAARVDLDPAGKVQGADVVVSVLQARPVRIKNAAEELAAKPAASEAFEAAARAVGDRAYRQCHPMANIPGDADYRREMIPVFVRRTLVRAARSGSDSEASE